MSTLQIENSDAGRCLAGIDIGTTSICIVIADAANGAVLHTAALGNDAALPSAHPWEKRQDPERIVALVEQLLGGCGEWKARLAAIGISCQMHGILYVNGEGCSVSPLFTWQDRRGDLPARAGGTESCAAELSRLGGGRAAAGYGLVTHYYNVRRGEIPPGSARLCTIGDYTAMRLTGAREPRIDVSNAAGLGLFDLERLRFDADTLRASGIGEAMLPAIAAAGEPAGRTPDGVPVAWAIGDNQASFIGAVPELEGALLVNVGTGSQVSLYAASPEAPEPLEARPCPGGGYLLVGSTLSGGKSYELLERFFRGVLAAFGGPGEQRLYAAMNELAERAIRQADAGEAEPPQVGTQFYGTRTEPERTGSIAGLTERNFTPEQLVLGFLNGSLDELLGCLSRFPPALRGGICSATGSGNGIRRNPALRRLIEDRLGLPLRLSGSEEEAAFGAAVHAGVSCGLFEGHSAAVRRMQGTGTKQSTHTESGS